MNNIKSQKVLCNPKNIQLSPEEIVNVGDEDAKIIIDCNKSTNSKHRYVCEYCGGIFSYRQGLHRHRLSRCKVKNDNDKQKSEYILTFSSF